jgi:hypothetical protein
MLMINQRMDKMAALHARLVAQGLLNKPLVPEGVEPVAILTAEVLENVTASEKIEAIVELARSPGIYYYWYHHELFY